MNQHPDHDSELRRQAEALLRVDIDRAAIAAAVLSPEATRQLLHDLQVHQIELELQNEELRRTQLELDASRTRYFDLYDLAPVGYCTLSADGRIVEANLTAATLLRVNRSTLVRQALSRFITREDQDIHYLLQRALLASGVPQSCELRMVRGDGTRFWASLAVSISGALSAPVSGTPDAENAVLFRVVISDVSERKQAETAQQASDAQYRQLAEDMPLFIATFLPDGTLTYVNEALLKLVAMTRAELTGLNFYDFLTVDDRLMVKERLAALTPAAPLETHEQRYLRAGESDGFQQWTNRAIFDDAGRVTRFHSVGEDISARRQAEAQLAEANQAAERANQAKSRFLAAASHDLRQPIQAINLFTDALNRTALDTAQQHLCASLALSVRGLGDLLNALLDISRLDNGSIRPASEKICAEALFRKVDSLFSDQALKKGLRFKLAFPLREMALIADRMLLVSLLGNLIGNAVKYTERGGVLIGIRRRGKQALIQIWDTGVGIAPEHLPDIFEEYFQVGNPERDNAKGLGLGLSIVRRLAGLLQTEVVCRSQPGRGSVFEFRLPLAELPLAAAHCENALDAAAAAPCGGRHVVIIDDNAMIVLAMRLSLESLGMRVSAFGTAEAALADPEIVSADFYISDFRLPGMNGFALLDGIEQRAGKPIRAVLLTGDTSPESAALMQSSRWPVLFKPIDLDQLLAAISAQDALN